MIGVKFVIGVAAGYCYVVDILLFCVNQLVFNPDCGVPFVRGLSNYFPFNKFMKRDKKISEFVSIFFFKLPNLINFVLVRSSVFLGKHNCYLFFRKSLGKQRVKSSLQNIFWLTISRNNYNVNYLLPVGKVFKI